MGTPRPRILLPRAGDAILTAFGDSDRLGCPYIRHSRMGHLLMLEGAPISWKPKSNQLSPDPLQKLNIGLWFLLLAKYCGFDGCYRILQLSSTFQLLYSVITKVLDTLPITQYSMKGQNMLRWTVSLFVKELSPKRFSAIPLTTSCKL